jgi:hypothetical protein
MIIPTVTKGILGTLGLATMGVMSVAVIGGLYLIVDNEVKEHRRRNADVIKVEDDE